MECFSGKFRQIVRRLLDSSRPVIAMVALKGGGLSREAKKRTDSRLIEVTRDNRDDLVEHVISRLPDIS